MRVEDDPAQQPCRCKHQNSKGYHVGEGQEVAEQTFRKRSVLAPDVSGVGKMMDAVFAQRLLEMGRVGMERRHEQCRQKYCQQEIRYYVSRLVHRECKDITNRENCVLL